MNFSDNEAALVRLKEEASRRLLKKVECVPRTCPVGLQQANDRVCGEGIIGHPILPWMPSLSAEVLNVHKRGEDGKTWQLVESPGLHQGGRGAQREVEEKAAGLRKEIKDWVDVMRSQDLPDPGGSSSSSGSKDVGAKGHRSTR